MRCSLTPFAALLTMLLASGCSDHDAPTPAGTGAGDAEKRAVFDKAEANSERNAKVTRRPRRFNGDSL